jgi:hypothetical protein
MSAHLHGTFVKGCYRCDLSRDEMTAQITEEAEEERWLRTRMVDILKRTAAALKGEPEPEMMHDWADLPDVAIRLRAERDQARAELTYRWAEEN